jgi:amino acid transporter
VTSTPTHGLGFGTAPVFLASISTILGAILFLRFGYAVGNVGLLGCVAIVLIGHLVTLPTALAIAEIATNRRVEGGGEYFIISRSFGTTIGGAIGIALYLSQAVSVAFYMIALAEAFKPLAPLFEAQTGMTFDPRFVSVPGFLLLVLLMVTRGAAMGVKTLWVVVVVLAASLSMFFLGSPLEGAPAGLNLMARHEDGAPFMLVFAIVFPAFTGMTAGVGLSGDLANPRKSIPAGILGATLVGMVMYIAIAFKLTLSATPEMLAGDQLIMGKIALWGPIIPIGLACACVSSAIGSLLVAPRTLQALSGDRVIPAERACRFLAAGVGPAGEPRNATLVTALLAFVAVLAGDVNFVARMISMFFMLTYGSLCAISALEHFAARPSYRPSFRSKWYLSLVGAISCLLLMVLMDPLFALLAITAMWGIYSIIRRSRGSNDLGVIFQGVMTQATRFLQVKLQKGLVGESRETWRPSIIMVNGRTFDRNAPIQLLQWLCERYAVGTYLHFVRGHLDRERFRHSQNLLTDLIESMEKRRCNLYVDTMISPSMRSALAQSLQVPGVSGIDNNTALFEVSVHDGEEVLEEAFEGCQMAWDAGMDTLVLRHGDHFFGQRLRVHIWLTWNDYHNANLMVLLAYILLGHEDWQAAEIRVFAAFPRDQVDEQKERLLAMAESGRVSISPRNLTVISTADHGTFDTMVATHSEKADLVIRGFDEKKLKEHGKEFFLRHSELNDVLFVAARQKIEIE